MATAVDRGALGPADGLARWRALALIAGVLAAVLAGVGWLQWQHLQQLKASLRSGSDLRVVEMQRQETEYLQLREQWQRALDPSTELDLRALSLRYDIWVGRVSMLKHDTPTRRMALMAQPQLDDTLRQVDTLVARADPVLANDATPQARRAALVGLHPQLLALGDPMHELALSAAHRAANDQTERTLALASHSRVTLGLTALLALLVLAFAGLSLRQMRLLSRRHGALQAMADELADARAAAEAANHAKTRFLADMSHEMRTPFQGLLSMLSMLRDTPLDPRQVDYLRTAHESADHLLAVLNDILDLSQLEAGRLQVHAAPAALRELVRDVESLMRPQALARGLELQVDIDRAVPASVRLDATRVKQVLFNLLSNAIKFCDHGQVTLDLRVRPGTGGRPELHLCVTDTGAGMDAPTLARLFHRFERGEPASPGAIGGSGLGLEISRRLARLMGGELSATSRPGQGSCFTLSLPLDAAAELQAFVPLPAPALPATAQLQVLIAEDHPINRQVLAALLDAMGHRSHFVADGAEAIAAVQQQRFDLVLMDLHMPGVDGIAATRAIRALPDRTAATVPIVALTADAFTDTRERCLVAGMNDFLSKPVGREKLGSLLRQLFGSGAGVEASAPRDPLHARSDVDDADTVRLLDDATVGRTRQALSAGTFASLLASYLDQSASTVENMRHAVRDAQPLQLRQLAHAVLGPALNLGLPGLAATARQLQEGAAHLPAHEVARLVQRFEDQVAATRGAAERNGLLPAGAVTR
jgi:signal transduction histidine kinase/DNA-binding response OmpR family regulator